MSGLDVGVATLDVERVRADFPVLTRRVHDDRPLVYLDSAATSQKPQQVLDAIDDYYRAHNANVHRGVHVLAEEATALYEGARSTVAAFIGAGRDEVVFTKNATEALNLVSNVLALPGPWRVGPGDEVLITEMEHHSNLVPWQMLCERAGATLRWIGITDDGRLDLAQLDSLITERTKVVSMVHVSNILGTVNPVEQIARQAKAVGALVVVDGSQAVPQLPYDVRALAASGVDLVAFTGHKLLGPTGIGVLWGRREVLDELPPFLGGGEMIAHVTMGGSTYAPVPHKFEAGTPPIAQAVGLAAAVDYLSALGMPAVAAHERELTAYALQRFAEVPGLRIIGPTEAVERGGAVSFVMHGAAGAIHSHDVGQVLDSLGIAVRVGNHCARPVCDRFGVPATTRASFYVYSTTAEIDAVVEGLERVRQWFG